MSKKLHSLFEGLGYRVTSDIVDEEPDRDAEIKVLTVRGKWYRGVSLKDEKVIFAFWQQQHYTSPYQRVPKWMADDLATLADEEGRIELDKLVDELRSADNVQTLFRFNRSRKERHLVVLLDYRFRKAFERVMPLYLTYAKIKEEAEEPGELLRKFSELAEKL